MKLGSILAGFGSLPKRFTVGSARLFSITCLRVRRLRPFLKWLLAWAAILTVVAALIIWVIAGLRPNWVSLWEGLTGVGGIQESWSATIRNLGLVVAGVLALGFAGWRTWVAHRQADTARQSLLDDRFQKATEMLGSPLLSVRLGGVYGLEALMKEYPDQYYVRGMRLLCAFVRSPTHTDPDSHPKRRDVSQSGSALLRTFVLATRLRQDVQAVMDVLRDRDAKWVALENESKLTPDFTGADLSRGDVNGTNLSGVILSWADLTAVNARGADLSWAIVESADFTQAVLAGAILTGVLFDEVTVTAAKFSSVGRDGTITDPVIGLTERSLLFSIAEEEHLPQLSGVVNSADGSYIKWDGMTLDKVGEQS